MSLLTRVGVFAQETVPAAEPIVGVADVDRVLRGYWRASQIKGELEGGRASDELRQKQAEMRDIEREIASPRFSFFRRNVSPAAVERKRAELQALT
ncbi:MAG: hypothetical protein HY801_10075, partial [Candidatus Lindowbacteria bacterium]|nr:hypothetical protein [Candidatus Lindowbacteria bacterium]